MNRHTERTDRLDNMLSAIEKLYLEAGNNEILDVVSGENSAVSEVRALIDQQVAKHKQSLKPLVKVGGKKLVGADVIGSSRIPSDIAGRLKLLRRLVATRSDVPPRMISVFSGEREPSDDEVNELMNDLIRLGIIKERNREK